MRDNQKDRVYQAEFQFRNLISTADSNNVRTMEIAGSTIVIPDELKFGTVESVRTCANAVLALSGVIKTYPTRATVAIRVRERQGQASAHYFHDEIAVPPHRGSNHSWAMREIVVLHELAHHLAPGVGHGAEFTEAFLFLVDTAMGPEASFILRNMLAGTGAK